MKPLHLNSIAILIIIILSIGIYANTLSNGFVIDDNAQVLQNVRITNIQYIPDILFSSVWAFKEDQGAAFYYRPIMYLFYMIEYYIFGLRPWGWHFVNILLHALNSIMVFTVASTLFRSTGTSKGINLDEKNSTHIFYAFISAVFFITHPINTEAVNYIACVPELSYALFYLLSFYFYMTSRGNQREHDTRGRKGQSYGAFFLSLLCFFLGLLAKETAVTLPFVLFMYDYAKTRQLGPAHLKRYVPYVIIVMIYIMMRLSIMGGIVPGETLTRETIPYIPNIFPLFLQYVGKLILPLHLSPFYVFNPVYSFLEPRTLISLAFTIVLILAVFTLQKSEYRILPLFTLVIVPIIPTFFLLSYDTDISFPPVFAERYLYLPMAGFAMILSLGTLAIFKRINNRRVYYFSSLILIIHIGTFIGGTYKRNFAWKDDYTLWITTIKDEPENYFAHYALAMIYANKGSTDKAIKELQEAARARPNFIGTHHALGLLYYSQGFLEKAAKEFKAVLKVYPEAGDAYYNLGIIAMDYGRWNEAISNLKTALNHTKNRGRKIKIHNDLAISLTKLGMIDEARLQLQKALEIDANDEETMKYLHILRGMKSQ